jgi:hypothetical protein
MALELLFDLWAAGRVSHVVREAGFAPANFRPRKESDIA